MLDQLIYLAAGLVVIYLGGRWIVEGGSKLAIVIGVEPVVVGLTVVAYGTSVPELFLGVIAGSEGVSRISFGNIIGSSISNATYVLGACAVLVPVVIRFASIRLESLFMILSVALLALLAIDGGISPPEGLLLLSTFVVGLFLMLRHQRKVGCPSCVEDEYREALKDGGTVRSSLFKLSLGIILLAIGAQAAVLGASGLASSAGISQFLIGLTIVSVGTNLPELTVSLIAARKHQTDLAVGNAVGSVTFNSLVVAGAASLFGGFTVTGLTIWIGLVPLIVFTAVLSALIWRKLPISRLEGVLMICSYVGYLLIAAMVF
jgi:cation:H+ antiporter